MNTSYNYADFIGLNLDSNAEHKSSHHEVTNPKPQPEKLRVKSVDPCITRPKPRLSP